MAVPTAVPSVMRGVPEKRQLSKSSKGESDRRRGYGTDTGLRKFGITGPVKAAALVFGDIGTSPIYKLTVMLLYLSSYRRLYQGSNRSRSTSSSVRTARRGRP